MTVMRRQTSNRARRGNMLATLLWFLPFALFGFSLAWDYTQAIAVTREATLTAEAMANAGATAFVAGDGVDGSAKLNKDLAAARARDMCGRAISADMLRETSTVATSCQRIETTDTSVAVQVNVSTRMSMASLLVGILQPGSPEITVDTVGRAQTDLCVPRAGNGVDQAPLNCVYPTNDLNP